MKEPVWLSYDLGMKGDYEGLYSWLDNHQARECGDSVAYFHFEFRLDLATELKKELVKSVRFETRNRIYIIWRKAGKIVGKFLLGGRKPAPWAGHGAQEQAADEEG